MAQNEDSAQGVDDDRPNLRVVGQDEAGGGEPGSEPADGELGTPESSASEDQPRSRLPGRRSRSDKPRSEKKGDKRVDKKGERRRYDKEAPEGPTQDPLVAAREVLSDLDPETAYKSLLTLVRPGHHDILQTLDYTPTLEFHDPTCVKVEPDPSGLETIDLYAHAAFPEFDRVLGEPFALERNDHLFNSIRNLLFNENQNVALVTNHGEIIDIALVLGAFLLAMCAPDRTFGVLGERVELDDLADRVNVLVSRMVVTQAALGVPAMQVLQIGGRTFLSVPQTASRKRAKLDADTSRANNTVMRHELGEQLAKGGQVLAMAASGSQDLSLAAGLMTKARNSWLKRRGDEPPEVSTLHLQPLYDGTIKLMRSCDYVLPVAISLDPTRPCCVLGEMTKMTESDDCHRVMDWIAEAHQEATGVPTIYHWHEDDLLTQVRSLAESFRR